MVRLLFLALNQLVQDVVVRVVALKTICLTTLSRCRSHFLLNIFWLAEQERVVHLLMVGTSLLAWDLQLMIVVGVSNAD